MLRLPSHSICIGQVGRRIEVTVGVDQRLGRLRAHRRRGQHRGRGRGAEAGQELAAGRAVPESQSGQLWNSMCLLPELLVSGLRSGLPR